MDRYKPRLNMVAA